MFFICAAALLPGCHKTQEEKPLWEQFKITELAPAKPDKAPGHQLLLSANFDAYIIEIPEENITELNKIWQLLTKKPFRFADYNDFSANSFVIGFGQFDTWEQIDQILRTAEARTVNKITLLISQDQTEDIKVRYLQAQQNVFYSSNNGSITGTTLGPGNIVLRIKAEKTTGSENSCNIRAAGVFSIPLQTPLQQIGWRQKNNEFTFEPTVFNLTMAAGNFILLGPQKINSDHSTLNNLFFSRKGPKPVVRIYLLLCTGVFF